MENNKQFLQENFSEILKQVNKKLEDKNNMEILSKKYQDILIKLDEIFTKEQKINREILEPEYFDFLRGIVFMKGSHEFHERLNGIVGFYIYNYRIQSEYKKYIDYEAIEKDIKNIINSEIVLLEQKIASNNFLLENKILLENIINLLNENKYVNVEPTKLLELIKEFKEINSEYQTNILIGLIDYNNGIIKKNEKNLESPEESKETVQEKIEPIKNNSNEPKNEEKIELVISSEEEAKKKVKSVRNIKKKVESKKKKLTKEIEEKNLESPEENVEYLDEKEIILSDHAKTIYSTIEIMISTMTKQDVENYIKDTLIWGESYLEEIKKYCNKKNKNNTDKVILEIFNAISSEHQVKETLGDGILIFKGYDETTSLVEKDLHSLKDDYHLESVKIYLEELKNKEINFALEAFHGDDKLKGSYHKKSRKAVRLCYELLGNGIYYVYDLTIKKSDNDKASKTKMINRRPNEYEIKKIKDLLENEETRQTIIEKNEQIYDNIIFYIEEEVPELKDEDRKKFNI